MEKSIKVKVGDLLSWSAAPGWLFDFSSENKEHRLEPMIGMVSRIYSSNLHREEGNYIEVTWIKRGTQASVYTEEIFNKALENDKWVLLT